MNGERLGESMFAIQCSPRHSPFAALFPISLFKVRYSMFAALFAIRRAVRHSPRHSPSRSPFLRHSPFASSFAAPFAISRAVSNSFPQFSLFKLRYSMFAAPLAICSSPFPNRRAIRHSPRHSLSLFNVP